MCHAHQLTSRLGQGGELQVLLEGCGGLPGLHIEQGRGEVHLPRAFSHSNRLTSTCFHLFLAAFPKLFMALGAPSQPRYRPRCSAEPSARPPAERMESSEAPTIWRSSGHQASSVEILQEILRLLRRKGLSTP